MVIGRTTNSSSKIMKSYSKVKKSWIIESMKSKLKEVIASLNEKVIESCLRMIFQS